MVTGIFCYRLRPGIDMDAYQAEAFRMFERVTGNPEFGFVDLKMFQGDANEGVLLAVFESVEGIEAWRNDPEHLLTQERGRAEFYDSYWGGEVIRHFDFDTASGRRDTPEREERLASLRQRTGATPHPAP